jgi:hypothetical protein
MSNPFVLAGVWLRLCQPYKPDRHIGRIDPGARLDPASVSEYRHLLTRGSWPVRYGTYELGNHSDQTADPNVREPEAFLSLSSMDHICRP